MREVNVKQRSCGRFSIYKLVVLWKNHHFERNLKYHFHRSYIHRLDCEGNFDCVTVLSCWSSMLGMRSITADFAIL